MASTHFPLSVQDLIGSLGQGTPTEVHDACLSLAIISWDPEGRKIILQNQCCPIHELIRDLCCRHFSSLIWIVRIHLVSFPPLG